MIDMTTFIKGMDLSRGFFHDCAKPTLDKYFPTLTYSAGLIGYGSDVLGYDDQTSTDHMWGPRFYLFLSRDDIAKKEQILTALSENLSYTYKGYSTNFTSPDPNDNGVQHPKLIREGKVNPLIFVRTFDGFLTEQLGTSNLDQISPCDWLAFSEHRLLSLVSGQFFADGLGCREVLSKIKYYPTDVKLYLIASNWEIIAAEQAFVKRCGMCGDDIGSRIICARICERLMRLCFLYKNTYAPYSKWFGTAFDKLDVDPKIKQAIQSALSADDIITREENLVKALSYAAEMHNASGLTEVVEYKIESYFGRDIKVIFAEKFAEAISRRLKGTPFEHSPRIGSASQMGGVSSVVDDLVYFKPLTGLYEM